MIEAFRRLYGSADGVRIFRAPGRVNLIGEHTDYNLGFVLPVALDLATYVATAPAPDGKLRIYSEDRKESAEWPVADLGTLSPRRHWTDYPLGVAMELIRAGFEIHPANLLIRSTVPEGSGLSSSAALEVSTALALLGGRHMPPLELARLCQRAERGYVGMPCGIMDQYISVFGEEHAAICIDCRSLKHQVVRLPDGIAFLAVNTMVKHELSGSAYKERTEQCAAAVEIVRQRHAQVESLRDVTPAMFEEAEQ
ncbi:MAG TPA: galactokinase family protein, partial [Bryobacteraceae bacterium]|nr:galactokinase family protein [Bryobacteraceae bacterium]